jgi:hypothetical protein
MAEGSGPSEFDAYSVGLCYASVCTSLPDDDAAQELNWKWPTGISSRWSVADEPFRDGSPNPTPCERNPETHRHVLFSC